MEIEEYNQVGLEEAISWLPSHVIDEACDSKVHLRNHEFHRERTRHGQKLPAEHPLPMKLQSKWQMQSNQKPRFPTNWASGGPGMQAIFLDSGRKSCGTGVFLPQRAGTNFQPSKKPACSPVLLPSRVVQALNLNVHALHLQVPPQRGAKNNSKVGHFNPNFNKNDKEVSTQISVASQNQGAQEIFLPKEWTY